MGIPWLFEVLTAIIRFDWNPILSAIENVWDVLNCLQGNINYFLFLFLLGSLRSIKLDY